MNERNRQIYAVLFLLYPFVRAGAAAAILRSVVNHKTKQSLHNSDGGRESERIWHTYDPVRTLL